VNFSGYNILEIRQASSRPQIAFVQSLRLVLGIAGRPEWILPLWIVITAVILSLAGVERRKANRERVVAPIG
jgi:hypothetical protein